MSLDRPDQAVQITDVSYSQSPLLSGWSGAISSHVSRTPFCAGSHYGRFYCITAASCRSRSSSLARSWDNRCSSASIFRSFSMNDEETLSFDYGALSLPFSSRRYIGRDLTTNPPEYNWQMSNGLTFDALAHDRVTKAYPHDLPFLIGITTSST